MKEEKLFSRLERGYRMEAGPEKAHQVLVNKVVDKN